jgi:hypothetical protein
MDGFTNEVVWVAFSYLTDHTFAQGAADDAMEGGSSPFAATTQVRDVLGDMCQKMICGTALDGWDSLVALSDL